MQDRKTYASGNTLTTEGFRCSVGEPIDIKVTVDESENVDLTSAAGKNILTGNYFITLDVNGENVAYRDLHRFGEDTVTIGDYTISDDMYLYGVSEDDEVVMRLEPVELIVTDAFRAAVAKTAPNASGGGTGGGVLVVNGTWDAEATTCTLDKTWQEIHDGGFGVVEIDDPVTDDKTYCPIVAVSAGPGVYFVPVIYYGDTLDVMEFSASSASGYPTYTDGE